MQVIYLTYTNKTIYLAGGYAYGYKVILKDNIERQYALFPDLHWKYTCGCEPIQNV